MDEPSMTTDQDDAPEDVSVLSADTTLLIVDDDEPFRNRLGRAMEKRGFQPILAAGVAPCSEGRKWTAPHADGNGRLRLWELGVSGSNGRSQGSGWAVRGQW